MFSLRSSLCRQALRTSRGRMSSVLTRPHKPVPECYQTSGFQKDFLSDPSTYPLIVILGMASAWIAGMSVNAFLTYKDLRIMPSHKHQVLRDWGDTETEPLTKRLADLPIVMHGKDYRTLYHEGLGVDHEEWKKAKRL